MPKPNTNKLILVTGATGKQGGAVLRHLRTRGFSVRALTRDPEKPAARALLNEGIEVVRGDLENMDSLRSAMEGAWGAYSVQTSTDGAAEVGQGKTVADAARRAGVSHFVYSSVAAANQDTGIPHFETKNQIEQHILGLGIPYTIIRPVFFMENWLMMKDQILQGSLPFPLSPDRKLQMIAVDDIGAFVTMAFERTGHWGGRAFDLAGDELNMTEVAQYFGRKLGRDVRYQQVSWDEFEPRVGSERVIMYRWFEEHGYTCDIAAARAELSSLTTFARWINNVSLEADTQKRTLTAS